MFYKGELTLELKICLPPFFKDDFEEDDEAMFQGVDGPSELIFCIPEIEKRVFHVGSEVMF
jgi:hypothetical protein